MKEHKSKKLRNKASKAFLVALQIFEIEGVTFYIKSEVQSKNVNGTNRRVPLSQQECTRRRAKMCITILHFVKQYIMI